MTVVSQIITDAYRETNLIAVGTQPTPAEQAEALARLQSLVSSVLGFEAGEILSPWPLGSNNIVAPPGFPQWTAQTWQWLPSNIRLVCNLTETATVNMNPMPEDGARFGVQDVSGNFSTKPLILDGNGRNIDGATTFICNTDGFNKEWFYRADLGTWKVTTPITADSDMPYPEQFDDFFIIALALRMNPRYSQSLAPESLAAMQRSLEQFKARYHQVVPTPADPATLLLSRQTSRNGYYSNGSPWPGAPWTQRGQFLSGWPY